jgi:Na+-translocating ferredoxin:NAD+ oxidoreductase subunit B
VSDSLTAQILAALPQTQCTRCGYPDCAGYAQAIAQGQAAISQCPPGGAEGIERLAMVTGQPPMPLNPANGVEGPRGIAIIDENWCIGCTLCIDACPTDAILGSNKLMHTVIEAHCTGCELCLPVCPVDCISMENVSGDASGWAAWSQPQADVAKFRYEFRSERRELAERQRQKTHSDKLHIALEDVAAHSRIEDPEALAKKRVIVEAALARAKLKAGVIRSH